MGTFSKFLLEAEITGTTDTDKIHIDKFNGIDVYVSKHAKDRQGERLSDRSNEELRTVWDKITKYIKDNPSKIGQAGVNGSIFRIRSFYNSSFVVSYRRSLDEPSNKTKNAYVVTMLEKGKDKPKSGTLLFILEHELNYQIIELD